MPGKTPKARGPRRKASPAPELHCPACGAVVYRSHRCPSRQVR